MKKSVFVSREVFGEALEFLKEHFEVASNQEDRVLSGPVLRWP